MGSPLSIWHAPVINYIVTTIGPVADELLAGAANAETARQVTEFADIIFIMVPDTPQVEEVLFGEHGCAKTSLQEVHRRYVFYFPSKPTFCPAR